MIRAAIASIRDELFNRWLVFPLASFRAVEAITDGLPGWGEATHDLKLWIDFHD